MVAAKMLTAIPISQKTPSPDSSIAVMTAFLLFAPVPNNSRRA